MGSLRPLVLLARYRSSLDGNAGQCGAGTQIGRHRHDRAECVVHDGHNHDRYWRDGQAKQFSRRTTERNERRRGQKRHGDPQRPLNPDARKRKRAAEKAALFIVGDRFAYLAGVASACFCGTTTPPQASRGRFCATPVLPIRMAVTVRPACVSTIIE